jgi:hypothetical protein
MAPEVDNPQVWVPPALIWLNLPAGGAAWPNSLLPQHLTARAGVSPHVCASPTVIWIKAPAGWLDSPYQSLPQHLTAPRAVSMQR